MKLELVEGGFGRDCYKIRVIVKQEVGRAPIHQSRRGRVPVHVDAAKHTFGWVADGAGETDHRAEDSFGVEVRS